MNIKDIVDHEFEKIDESSIAGYRIVRSIVDRNFHNVYAVDKDGELLVCIAVDLDPLEAMTLVSALNTPYDVDPALTELVEVQDGCGNIRMFYAAK